MSVHARQAAGCPPPPPGALTIRTPEREKPGRAFGQLTDELCEITAGNADGSRQKVRR